MSTTLTKQKIFHDDIYLIDASVGCEVISLRQGARRLSRGDPFLKIIDSETKPKLFEYLVSFDPKPLKISTDCGEATVYGGIFPSSTLFLAQFKKDSEAEDIFCLSPEALSLTVPYKDELCRQALEVSALCGCPIDLQADELAECEENSLLFDFDFSLYTAFLINGLLLARRTSKERRAKVILKTKEESPFVSIIFEPANELSDIYDELSSISAIADKLHILFTRSLEGGKVSVTVNPTRKNWALLGLKTPLDFIWDDEDPTA